MKSAAFVLTLAVAVLGAFDLATAQGAGSSATEPSHATFANVTDERLRNAASEPDQWMTYGGTFAEQRYSTLAQINRSNVKQMGLAWFADFDTNLTQEATPLFIDGVIYVSTAWSKVYAFDARSGKTLWEFNPQVPGQWVVNTCCGLVNRGVAAYKGKIYLGTLDGRLIALDARTGKPVWSVQTTPTDQPYSITGAPRIVKGRVLIGNGGADFGVRGYLTAYDAETGKLAWRFYLVPGNPALGPDHAASDSVMPMATKTWRGEWWKGGGGGTPWDSIVYDPQLDLLYIGSGNGGPWNARIRSPGGGDNLFLSSIVAVRPETGKYVWHYLETPRDSWDYTAVQPMMLADIQIDGARRRVLMQAPKNGMFYVLDARTGKLLRANPYIKINWADGVDTKTGRPRVKPEAYYGDTGKPFTMNPGPQGAHSWNPMAFSPQTGLVYLPVQNTHFRFAPDPHFVHRRPGGNMGVDMAGFLKQVTDFAGYLEAWDPVAGKVVWSGPKTRQGQTGGALATAGGLVFQGGGDARELIAYDARTGEKLWSTQAQTSVLAGPITYELDGKQYVAVSAGGNEAAGYYAPNYSRLLVYALDGSARLPTPVAYTPPPLNPPPATAPAALVQAGREQYIHYCQQCHGQNGQSRGADFPDIRRTPLLYSQAGFDAVVLQGVRTARGMVSFAQVLTPADTSAIRAFVIAQANELKKQSAGGNGRAQKGAAEREGPT